MAVLIALKRSCFSSSAYRAIYCLLNVHSQVDVLLLLVPLIVLPSGDTVKPLAWPSAGAHAPLTRVENA